MTFMKIKTEVNIGSTMLKLRQLVVGIILKHGSQRAKCRKCKH